MKIGLFTCSYQRYPLEKAFQDAAHWGYDYIELWGGRPHAFPKDLIQNGCSEIKELADQYQIPIRIYTPEHNGYPYNYMNGSLSQWEDAIEYLETAIEVTANLGAEYMLFSAGHAGYLATQQQIDERLYKSLNRICDVASSYQVELLFEPLSIYETNVCCTASRLKEILEDMNRTCFHGMIDMVVPFTSREPIQNYFALCKNQIRHIHFVDADGYSEDHLVPGMGQIPLKGLLQQIREVGYDGTMTIELVTKYLNEPELYAGMAIENVRRMMDESSNSR